MAAEYGPQGIRVNAVAPGLIRDSRDGGSTRPRRRLSQQRYRLHAAHAGGQPAEVAGAAAFLCSDDASFVTGHILLVDDGLTATRVRLT